ncbi:MAG: sodium:proton antiporter, partial [Actinomycetota bacterium]
VVGLILDAQGATPQSMSLELRGSAVQTLLEGTLVIILFSDAAVINLAAVKRDAFLPGRLLGIGLPLTVGVGAAAAMLILPELGFWPAVVVAVILAPTDAALGQAVIANEDVPGLVRQGLGVEAGLNDGIVVPFLTIALAGAANEMQSGGEIARVFIEEIGLAIAVGVLVGWAGGQAVKFVSSRGWITREWRQVSVVSLAVVCFVLADPIGGSGFIAAFVGGIVFGNLVRRDFPEICHFSEGISHLLTMIAFFVFGVLILVPVLTLITWQIVAYAIISLTIVRMVPVAVSLIGTSLGPPSKLYIGWFGPRGLASLVFMGTVVIESDPAYTEAIVAVGATTVALSVLAHGLSAWPGSVRYASWYRRSIATVDAGEMPESREVAHMPPTDLASRVRRSVETADSPVDG